MRIVGLCLLGLLSYLIAMVVFFPASPVVDRIRPALGPVALEGVGGRLFNGSIDRVRSTDDLLPLEFRNVGWSLAPLSLLKARPGASITFDAYGGTGKALVERSLNGDIIVSDFDATLQAKTLEPLLPVPVASFAGELLVDIDQIKLENALLTRFDGNLRWQNALLETPVAASLGNVSAVVEPQTDQSHIVTLAANGGDVSVDGTITIKANGDFAADILLVPASGASAQLRNAMTQIGRPDAQGRIRIRQQGNVNRLM